MIDLHSHSLYSDGELLPAEALRRVTVLGYRFLGITDHVDASNYDLVVERLRRAALELNKVSQTKLIPGVEFTHVPPSQIRFHWWLRLGLWVQPWWWCTVKL